MATDLWVPDSSQGWSALKRASEVPEIVPKQRENHAVVVLFYLTGLCLTTDKGASSHPIMGSLNKGVI